MENLKEYFEFISENEDLQDSLVYFIEKKMDMEEATLILVEQMKEIQETRKHYEHEKSRTLKLWYKHYPNSNKWEQANAQALIGVTLSNSIRDLYNILSGYYKLLIRIHKRMKQKGIRLSSYANKKIDELN